MDVTLILEKGLEKLRNIIIRKRGLRKFRLENSRSEIKNSLGKKPPHPKRKTCPRGKKSCTCWLCHEEGHYANECPKKDNPKKNVLHAIYALGYEN